MLIKLCFMINASLLKSYKRKHLYVNDQYEVIGAGVVASINFSTQSLVFLLCVHSAFM